MQKQGHIVAFWQHILLPQEGIEFMTQAWPLIPGLVILQKLYIQHVGASLSADLEWINIVIPLPRSCRFYGVQKKGRKGGGGPSLSSYHSVIINLSIILPFFLPLYGIQLVLFFTGWIKPKGWKRDTPSWKWSSLACYFSSIDFKVLCRWEDRGREQWQCFSHCYTAHWWRIQA